MEELYGVLEKGAFKVTSGFRWKNNTVVNSTCEDGENLQSIHTKSLPPIFDGIIFLKGKYIQKKGL